jgi:NAD-dependent SIR2 family protein deacetylase
MGSSQRAHGELAEMRCARCESSCIDGELAASRDST